MLVFILNMTIFFKVFIGFFNKVNYYLYYEFGYIIFMNSCWNYTIVI